MNKNRLTLAEASIGRQNNLNIIRLIAALMVLYMHSLNICWGHDHDDIIFIMTGGMETAGGLAVDIFFIISGFLITRSYDRCDSLIKYVKARVLRIWPLLFIVVTLTTFVLGPLLTTVPMQEYFNFSELMKFYRNAFFVNTYSDLPGVFLNHPVKSLNGSLWTLMHEVICYGLVVLFAPIWKRLKAFAPISFLASALIYIYMIKAGVSDVAFLSGSFLYLFVKLYMFFAAGMSLYLFADKIIIDGRVALAQLVFLVVGSFVLDFCFFFAVCGSYIILYLSFQKKFVSTKYEKVGDLSYGIYVFAFPVQQLVLHYMGEYNDVYYLYMNPYLNMLVSLVIVVPLAWCSWRFIEKPCINLKNKK